MADDDFDPATAVPASPVQLRSVVAGMTPEERQRVASSVASIRSGMPMRAVPAKAAPEEDFNPETAVPASTVSAPEAFARGAESGFAHSAIPLAGLNDMGGSGQPLSTPVPLTPRARAMMRAQGIVPPSQTEMFEQAEDRASLQPGEVYGAGGETAAAMGGAVGGLPLVGLEQVAGGPATAFALNAAGGYTDRKRQLVNAGVRPEEAAPAAAVAGLVEGAFSSSPMGLAGGAVKRVVSGAAAGAAGHVVGTEAQNLALPGDRPDLQQDALDPEGILRDAIFMGAMHGAGGHRGAEQPAAKTPTDQEMDERLGAPGPQAQQAAAATAAAPVHTTAETPPAEVATIARLQALRDRMQTPEAQAGYDKQIKALQQQMDNRAKAAQLRADAAVAASEGDTETQQTLTQQADKLDPLTTKGLETGEGEHITLAQPGMEADRQLGEMPAVPTAGLEVGEGSPAELAAAQGHPGLEVSEDQGEHVTLDKPADQAKADLLEWRASVLDRKGFEDAAREAGIPEDPYTAHAFDVITHLMDRDPEYAEHLAAQNWPIDRTVKAATDWMGHLDEEQVQRTEPVGRDEAGNGASVSGGPELPGAGDHGVDTGRPSPAAGATDSGGEPNRNPGGQPAASAAGAGTGNLKPGIATEHGPVDAGVGGDTPTRYEAQTQWGTVTVDRSHDVPLGATASKDGKTVYIDKDIPRYAQVNGKQIDRDPFLLTHELDERNQEVAHGDSYTDAHDHATVAEDQHAESQGLKAEDYQATYTHDLARAAAKENPQLPPDMVERPYEHPHGERAREALAEVQAAEKGNATDEGKQPQDGQQQHQDRNEGRQAAEAGGGHRADEGRQEPAQKEGVAHDQSTTANPKGDLERHPGTDATTARETAGDEPSAMRAGARRGTGSGGSPAGADTGPEARSAPKVTPEGGKPRTSLEKLEDAEGVPRGTLKEVSAPPKLKTAVEAIGKLFGVKVTFFDGPVNFDGIKVKSLPNEVFINRNAQAPHIAVLMHELTHHMQFDDPDLWRSFQKAVVDSFSDEELARYNKAINEKQLSPETLRKEMIADILADHSMSDRFWRDLSDKMSFSKFGKLISWVRGFFSKLLGRAGDTPFKSSQYFKDYEKLYDSVNQFAADYLMRKGVRDVEGTMRESLDDYSLYSRRVKEAENETPAERNRVRQAIPTEDMEARRAIGKIDTQQEAPEVIPRARQEAAARYRLNADYENRKQAIIDKLSRGETLSPSETTEADILTEDALGRGDNRLATWLRNSHNQSRTELARSLAQRLDPVESPAGRAVREFQDQLLAPSQSLQREITQARDAGNQEKVDQLLDKHADTIDLTRDKLRTLGIDPDTLQHVKGPTKLKRVRELSGQFQKMRNDLGKSKDRAADLAKIVRNRVQAGYTDFDELARHLGRQIPGLKKTPEEITEAWNRVRERVPELNLGKAGDAKEAIHGSPEQQIAAAQQRAQELADKWAKEHKEAMGMSPAQRLEFLRQKIADKQAKVPQEVKDAVAAINDRKRELQKQIRARDRSILQNADRALQGLQVIKADGWDAAYEWARSAMHTSFTLPIKKIASDVSNGLYRNFLEKPLAASFRKATGQKGLSPLQEMQHVFAGMAPGFSDGLRNALQSWKWERNTFEDEFGHARAETLHARGEPYKQFGGEEFHRPPSIGNPFLKHIRWNIRAVGAIQAFAQTLLARMEVGAHAHRSGIDRGLSGDALANHIAAEVGNLGSDSWAAAVADSRAQSGTTAPSKENPVYWINRAKNLDPYKANSDAGYWLQRGLKETTRYTFPFATLPFNFVAKGAKISPLGSVAMLAKLGNSLVKRSRGGEWTYKLNDFNRDAAQQVLSWAAAAILAGQLDDKDGAPQITGYEAWDPKAARIPEPPSHSVKLGGEWRDYASLGPVAHLLGTTVDLLRTGKDIAGGRAPTAALADLAASTKEQIMSETFLRGLHDLVGGMESGDKVQQLVTNYALEFYPTMFKQLGKAANPDLEDRTVKAQGILPREAQLLKRGTEIPVWQSQPKVDLLGADVRKDSGETQGTDYLARLVNPFTGAPTARDENDDIRRAFVVWNQNHPDDKLAFQTPRAEVQIKDKHYPMDEQQYHDFLVDAGERAVRKLRRAGLDYNDPDSWTPRQKAHIERDIRTAQEEAKHRIAIEIRRSNRG